MKPPNRSRTPSSQVPPSNVGEVLLADGVTVVGTGAYSLADLRGMQFRPTANSSGSATFLFRVQDNGGTASGGYDVLTEAMTISVTSLADTVGLFYADASIFTLKTTGTSNQDDGFQVQFYSKPAGHQLVAAHRGLGQRRRPHYDHRTL